MEIPAHVSEQSSKHRSWVLWQQHRFYLANPTQIQLMRSASFGGRSEYYECIACVSNSLSAELDSSEMGIQALYEIHSLPCRFKTLLGHRIHFLRIYKQIQ